MGDSPLTQFEKKRLATEEDDKSEEEGDDNHLNVIKVHKTWKNPTGSEYQIKSWRDINASIDKHFKYTKNRKPIFIELNLDDVESNKFIKSIVTLIGSPKSNTNVGNDQSPRGSNQLVNNLFGKKSAFANENNLSKRDNKLNVDTENTDTLFHSHFMKSEMVDSPSSKKKDTEHDDSTSLHEDDQQSTRNTSDLILTENDIKELKYNILTKPFVENLSEVVFKDCNRIKTKLNEHQ